MPYLLNNCTIRSVFSAANVSKFPLSSSIIAEKLSDTPEKLFGFTKKTSLGIFSICPPLEINVSKAASDKLATGIIFPGKYRSIIFFGIRLVKTSGSNA